MSSPRSPVAAAPGREPASGAIRTPPHNLAAEESLLGAMLLSRDAIAAAAEVVRAEHFYKPAHCHIFDAITALYSTGDPADVITVAEELNRAGLLDAIGGAGVLVTLQSGAPAVSNAGRYARIIEELALLRTMIATAGEIAELGYSLPDDVAKAIDNAESMIFNIAQHRSTTSTTSLHELLGATLDRLEQLYERGESITGTPTGYVDLDELLAGLQPNALVVVGARPAMGKTAFALGAASYAALHGRRPVLVFSLEMSQLEITQRLLSSEARVDASRMRTGKLNEADWEKIGRAVGPLAEAKIWVDDNPNVTVMEIRSKARKLKSQLGDLGLVVVDYVQLMTGRTSAENRQVEVAEISRGLKILAREIEAPVMALAQLNRGLEQRADKRPMLSDLRESGCLPASVRVLRADTGTQVTVGELAASGARPLVWSVDAGQRLVAARLVKTFPTGVKPVFRLRLRSGRWVDATANHPFLTRAGWAPLGSLRPGCRVATPRRLPLPVVPAADWPEEQLVQLGELLRQPPSNGVRCAAPLRADAPAGTVAGADGTLVAPAGTAARSWPGPRNRWAGTEEAWGVPEEVFGMSDRAVACLLRQLLGARGPTAACRSDTLPASGPVEQLAQAFTGGREGPAAVPSTFTTASEGLAFDVQRLLLRVGLRSTVDAVAEPAAGDGNWPPSYRVCIDRSDRPTGPCAPATAPMTTTAIATASLGDGAPGPGPAGAPVPSDLCWEEVTAIEPLGAQPTFDLTIEGTHNFLANDVVVHNSLEQDADVVLFLYRDEVYNRETQDQGIAEVIVAKHRSGPTGTVRLAFLGQYTRFANMARTP